MEKELTIEHWAAYLPYGIKAKVSRIGHFNLDTELPFPYSNEIGTVKTIWFEAGRVGGVLIMGNGWEFDFDELEEITVCVRPLSQLTETIEHGGERFVPLKRMFEMEWPNHKEENPNRWYYEVVPNWAFISHNSTATSTKVELGDIGQNPWWMIQIMLSWHFDIYHLIEAGLAEPIPSIPQP